MLPCVSILHLLCFVQINCEAGKWSDVPARTTPCTDLCTAGYVCSAGSSTPNPQTCGGAQFYCPAGTAAPVSVSAGYYSTGGTSLATQTSQAVCPSPLDAASNGSAVYCPGTDGLIHVCPAGAWGNSSGLVSSACSGPCAAGYYCPSGSVNATAVPCGGTAV